MNIDNFIEFNNYDNFDYASYARMLSGVYLEKLHMSSYTEEQVEKFVAIVENVLIIAGKELYDSKGRIYSNHSDKIYCKVSQAEILLIILAEYSYEYYIKAVKSINNRETLYVLIHNIARTIWDKYFENLYCNQGFINLKMTLTNQCEITYSEILNQLNRRELPQKTCFDSLNNSNFIISQEKLHKGILENYIINKHNKHKYYLLNELKVNDYNDKVHINKVYQLIKDDLIFLISTLDCIDYCDLQYYKRFINFTFRSMNKRLTLHYLYHSNFKSVYSNYKDENCTYLKHIFDEYFNEVFSNSNKEE